MSRNNHVVVIRFHFPENHPNFMWRFQYFAAVTLPAIRRQSFKDFDLAIWCNSWHENLFKSLDQSIITFGINGYYLDYAKLKNFSKIVRGLHVDHVPWGAVRGLGKYEIQTAIDSDDLMIDTFYLEKTREVLVGSGTAHVCFAPLIFDLATLRTYTCRLQYSTERGSAFYSLYQPEDRWGNYVFAYEDSHLRIGQMMDRRIFVSDNRYVAVTCHDKNDSTNLGIADKQIMPTTSFS
ncbi:MAG: hypothetical protein PHO92_00710 [Candidatus Peribacteraceae bacterium]|nr:hypothetical protein [Candidatus Peribacteraceae bacterium]